MRGEVYRLRGPRETRGHEQSGERYAVVVLATRYSYLSQWLVVPTSTRAQPAGFRPRIRVGGTATLALCDALVAIDPDARLADQVDYLGSGAMDEIDEALVLLLDLDRIDG
jgi:mRNA interferase MazF